ncbi:MAG TPA: UDP-N-acetylmuramoyl-L-alanyl-D-glutamate--2,6-diaminopimelate ligase [Mycobacteriales bacterium]|nr:UDP-N-acetylmuramoyl-L-alanyl-D-glutamate--2,6-diaminopimelate ligase [Mycobacteriales bacterium]
MPTPHTPRPRAVAPHPLTAVAGLLTDAVVSVDSGGVVVTGVTHDSRAVVPGDLYVGLPGSQSHGADFAGAARDAGAAAILTDRPGPHPLPSVVVERPRAVLGKVAAFIYGEPSRAIDVVGVTGTNGKTTTAYLLEAGLRAAGRRTGLIGTVETRVGDRVLPSAHTTPEAPDLQALLAVMREDGVDAVAMEVSSHGLALGRVDGTRYAAAIFTNLSQDHLDFHADMDDYFKAKAKLFEGGRSQVAVINVDDPAGERLLHMTRLPVTTTSATARPVADWQAADIRHEPRGTTFRVLGPAGEDVVVHTGLTGDFNVANALGALAALASIGIDVGAAAAGIGALDGVPGRLERVAAGQDWVAVVDYAHTPDSVESVLRTLRPITRGRLIAVLGCGGDRDRGKRPLMGRAMATYADVAVVTSDNPRSEDPQAIIDAMLTGACEADAEVHVEVDRHAAIDLAVSLARPGDVLALLGKGHEQGQTFADRTTPFDDRLVLREAIRRSGGDR